MFLFSNLKKIGKISLLATLAISLSACSSLNEFAAGDRIDYKSGSAPISPLEVPPNINIASIEPGYVAPDAQTFSQFVKQRENGGNKVLPTTTLARIERDGNRRWLVVNLPADEVWPKLQKFWQDLGFKLEVNSPETGILETNWLENKGNVPNDALRRLLSNIATFVFSSDKKDRFRTRIERLSNKETEVYVTHAGVEEQFVDQKKDVSKYYARASEPELEAEILRKMMLELGLTKEQSNYLAQEYKSPDKTQDKRSTSVTQPQGNIQELRLSVDATKAWRSVGIALDRAGFTMESKNAKELTYVVLYTNPENFNKQTTFLQRLSGKSIESFRKAKAFTISLKVLGANITQVEVSDESADIVSQRRILQVIQDNL